MHCDCQAAISIAKNKEFNGKNIYEVVKQLFKDRIISIDYVKSEAHHLTKPLGRKLILETLSGMGLKPIRD